MLSTSAAVGSALAVSQGQSEEVEKEIKVSKRIRRVAKNGNIKHSIVAWCFQDFWSPDELMPIAKEMGCDSVELMDSKYYPDLKKNGMECAIAGIDIGGPPFMQGFNNPKYHDLVIAATKKSIDECKEFGWKKVIAFTGYEEGLTKEEGAANCVTGFKEVVGYAEKAGVTICLEHLNTRDDTHPMKGHPGYQGDDVEYCIDILKSVGSPNLKLLFDIYHVSIMNGDVIRRIHEHKDWLGHIHTAGNPGRAELDDQQEINYPGVMRAILNTGYDGYVAQEFIPTWEDKALALRHAAEVCDV